ncbi:hypothetical protein BT67DRAFT_56059 [Trichocladium antarcticum]|uniref:Uncharacterized protein n=1 Tax=Trichocladium antarcticum TaxID=1450529 RepID=A0AAN6ZCU0_9PEZI|nr:hypothetical protein BT67DRAFT_56059 [Trichocladium antarcticum]
MAGGGSMGTFPEAPTFASSSMTLRARLICCVGCLNRLCRESQQTVAASALHELGIDLNLYDLCQAGHKRFGCRRRQEREERLSRQCRGPACKVPFLPARKSPAETNTACTVCTSTECGPRRGYPRPRMHNSSSPSPRRTIPGVFLTRAGLPGPEGRPVRRRTFSCGIAMEIYVCTRPWRGSMGLPGPLQGPRLHIITASWSLS